MEQVTLRQESPLGADLALLFSRHTADMFAETPPESVYMLDAGDLAVPEVRFYVLREAGTPMAMGAIKQFAPDHAEIKSMHVLREARGKGYSKRMLQQLIAAARATGVSRLSLETGVEKIFIPARALYAQAGFEICGPFGSYGADPNSCFMTLSLASIS